MAQARRLSLAAALRTAHLAPHGAVAEAVRADNAPIHAKEPVATPTTAAPPAKPARKVSLHALRRMYEREEPLVVITAYDYPSARTADAAGADVLLVGDSLGMVVLGQDDTTEVRLI